MTIRERIARWLCPELGKKADRYWFLCVQIDDSHQWLSAYPDVRDTLARLLELDRDHWRTLDEPATGKLPSEIWRFRELLTARHAAKWEEDRKIRDVAYHLGDDCVPGNIDLLEQVANDIDCGRDCDHASTEHDTNAFNCPLMEKGKCAGTAAEELRQLATAFRNRAKIIPDGVPS